MAVPRLQEKYEKEILPALKEQLGQENRMALPRLEKVVVNMGVGSAITEKVPLQERLRSEDMSQGPPIFAEETTVDEEPTVFDPLPENDASDKVDALEPLPGVNRERSLFGTVDREDRRAREQEEPFERDD